MEPKRIKELRKRMGWAQAELARQVGVDTTTVNRWENEKQKPSQMALRQLKRLGNYPLEIS